MNSAIWVCLDLGMIVDVGLRRGHLLWNGGPGKTDAGDDVATRRPLAWLSGRGVRFLRFSNNLFFMLSAI